MAHNIRHVTIFLASPADVQDERNIIVSVVDELNRALCKSINVHLDIISYEKDIYPNVASYPQEVINTQINDNYDIFIAIFWSKIGSQTKTAESGTVEEFNRAYSKLSRNPDELDIMIYFKDQPKPPSQIDPEQLSKLNSFKEQLNKKGVLYKTVGSKDDFESHIRIHLSLVADKWSKKINIASNDVKDVEPEQLDEYTEEDLGLLDYAELQEEHLNKILSALADITEATSIIGEQTNARVREIEQASTTSDLKKILKDSSEDLYKYSQLLNEKLVVQSQARVALFYALSKNIAILLEINKDDYQELYNLKDELKTLIQGVSSAQENMFFFRGSVANLPPLKIEFLKAKRAAVNSLDALLEELKNTILSANNTIQTIEQQTTVICT